MKQTTVRDHWNELVDPAETVAADTPLRDVIAALVERRETRTLLVLGGDDRYVGIISIFNLLRYAEVLVGSSSGSLKDLMRFSQARTARDVMFNPVSVGPDASISEVLEVLNTHGLPEVPVVDKGEVVGRINSVTVLALCLRL